MAVFKTNKRRDSEPLDLKDFPPQCLTSVGPHVAGFNTAFSHYYPLEK